MAAGARLGSVTSAGWGEQRKRAIKMEIGRTPDTYGLHDERRLLSSSLHWITCTMSEPDLAR